jgi:hypothetical protein
MWEWRIFFQNNQKDSISSYDDIKSIVQPSSLETRYDYYYLIDDHSIGLKERGPSHSGLYHPKLELKIRTDQQTLGCEYWLKPIREYTSKPIDQSKGLEPEEITTILNSYTSKYNQTLNNYIAIIIEYITSSEIIRFETKKYRKQVPFAVRIERRSYPLTIELTKIELLDEVWETIEIEGSHIEAVEYFVKEYFPEKLPFVMGYPHFLLEKNTSHFP